VAEHFPHAESRWLRVKKVLLILILKANPGANPNSLWPRSNLRRFKPLFAAAQSTAASKLANPLKSLSFLVFHPTSG
jgi:hypothetical protein